MGTQECGTSCAICKYIEKSDTFQDVKGNKYVMNDHIDCKSSNIIYGIRCQQCCELIYVGETGVTLFERFQNHISSIKNRHNQPIPNHFNSENHGVGDLRILGIEKVKQNNIFLRKSRETFWIKKLDTLTPAGLNMNEGLGD